MMKFLKIAVIGSINYDSTFDLVNLPRPGETVLSKSRTDRPGGKGANQAVAIAAQGEPVELLACVGEDGTGEYLRDYLGGRGVGVESVEVLTGYSTGAAMILVASSGENEIVVNPGANVGLRVDTAERWLAPRASQIVLMQLETPIETVLAAAATHRGMFILNPAPVEKPTPQLQKILSQVDLLVPNREELATLAGVKAPKSEIDVVKAVGLLETDADVVVTLGSEGAIVFPGGPRGTYARIPAGDVVARDTSGAGDVFCAGLAVGLSRGASLLQAAKHAVALASWSVTEPGAQVGDIPAQYRFAS